MAITRDQAATLVTAGGTTTAITWATLPTAGAKVLVAFTSANNLTPNSVIDNGTSPATFTLDKGPGTGGVKLFIYRADAITLPSSGNYKVTVTWPSASGGASAWGQSYLGVASGAPTSSNTGTGTSASVSTGTATPAAAGALYFATFDDLSGANPETITLTGSGFTEQATQTNGATFVCEGFADKIDSSGPTATACTWTLGDAPGWNAQIVTYDAGGATRTATLTGSGTLSGSPYFQAAAAMSGTGSLSAHTTIPTVAALSGTGTLGSSLTLTASTTLSGQGTLSALPVLTGAAAVSGAGTLGASPQMSAAGALTGQGSLTPAWTGQLTSVLSGTGSLAGGPVLTAAATLAGTGSMAIAPVLTASGAMSGTGSLTGNAILPPLTVIQAAAPVFVSGLSGPVNITLPQATGLSGSSTLVVCASSESFTAANPHVTGITIGGSADHFAGVITHNSSTRSDAEIWYDPGCASGQTALAVTFGGGSGSTGGVWASAYEVAGILVADQTSAAEITAATFSSGTTATVSEPAEIFFGCTNAGDSSVTAITPTGSGTWTAEASYNSGAGHCSAYQQVSAGGTATFSGTVNNSEASSTVTATFHTPVTVTSGATMSGQGTLGGPVSYRLWPSGVVTGATSHDTAVNYVIATEIALSEPCATVNIWYYSPAGTAQFATRASVWTILGPDSGTEVVAVSSPSWLTSSGAAATAGTAQWVKTAVPGVPLLAAGKYKVSVYNGAATPDQWSSTDSTGYWTTGGPGASGISNGPVSAPGLSSASLAYILDTATPSKSETPPYSTGVTVAAQGTFANFTTSDPSPNQYPYLYWNTHAENLWVDLEVIKAASLPALAGGAALSGSGTLASSGEQQPAGATLSGAGTLQTASQLPATAALAGSGTLGAVSQLAGAAAMSGIGSLSAAPYFAGTVTLSGAGTLSAPWTATWHAAISGSGTLTAAPYMQAAAAMSGLGSLTALPVLTGTGALSGSGTLSTAPIVSVPANLSGSGVLGTAPVLSAAAALSGSGTLTALWKFGEIAGLSGIGTLNGVPGGGSVSSAALSGTGTLSGAPVLSVPVTLAGLGTLAGVAQLAGAAVLSGAGSLAGGPGVGSTGLLNGLGSLAAAPVLAAAVILSGSGTMSSAPARVAASVMSGAGTLSAAPVLPGVAGMSGLGALTAGGQFTATGPLAGQGTLFSSYVAGYLAAALMAGSGTLAASFQLGVSGQAVLTGLGTLLGAPVLTAPGDTGTVDWRARPDTDRWNTTPALPRWLARVTLPRWSATLMQRWRAAPAPPRWEIVMATFEPISALSLEEINVTWTSDLDGTTIDPTQGPLTVQFAVPVSSGILSAPAQPVTWFAASWLLNGVGKGYISQGLVGPTAGTIVLVSGTSYDVWSRILGSPEQPTKFVGTLPVY